MENDVIIIGGAFAGLTAAIYSARQGMNTLLITKDIGGQGLLTTDIQNYPGFNSISGFDLASKFQEQASLYGVRFVYDEVTNISSDGNLFKIKTFTGEFESEGLILAFGKTPRDLNVKGEEKLKGLGVSYCSICDVLLFNCMVPNKEYTLEELAQLSGKDKTTVFRSMQKLTSIGVVIKNSRTIPRGGYYHTYNLSDIDNIKKISIDRINSTHEGFIQLLDQLIEDISTRINPVL